MASSVAIVTGAGRGIGRATAIELGRRGYRTALVARTPEQLEETARLCAAEAIGSAGDSAPPAAPEAATGKTAAWSGGDIFPGDITDPDRVEQIVNQVIWRLGRVDAFVHCAGVAPMKPIDELTPVQWRQIIDTNLSAIYYFARQLWPIWRRQGSGVMVNVSSYAARDPFAGLAAYGAAKAGVNLLGLALAREGAAAGIRVHTVAPAATETAMLREIMSVDQLPTGRTLDPSDVARVIGQCVTGDLVHTSGEVIYVHKGF